MSDFTLTDSNDLTVYREAILGQLTEAGGHGLALPKLVSRKSAERSRQEKALKELEKGGGIKSLRQGKSTRYWLTASLPVQVSPEEKADEVLRHTFPEQRTGRLFTVTRIREELLKGLSIPDSAIHTCLRVMEQEGLILKLFEGTKTLYAYAPSLRTLLGMATPTATAATSASTVPAPSMPKAEPSPSRLSRASDAPLPVTNQRVIEAYRSVRLQRRLPDVEIARLQEVLHCSAEELKPVVARLCDQGIFIPGKGDWSFATPAARAAAVLIQGDPYLFVRMKD